jgi:arylsulfatase A-like enzyme
MNILFVSIEDLNDWIEPLGGHPQVKTPNLNRLAARGMVFDNASAVAPACSPSRTATLFGQAPWRSGVYTNDETWDMAYPHAQRLSLVGAIRSAGWKTIGAGKVFHKDIRGFDPDDWDQYNTNVGHLNYPPISATVKKGDLRRLSDFGPVQGSKGCFDAQNTNWMCRKIRPGDDGQFWGFGLYRPHLPFIVPQQYFDLYPETVGVPPGLKGVDFDPDDRDEVLDRLDETGQTDNTLIVLWSDHGWQFGEKLAFRKFTLWERALRVPLIVAGPGVAVGRWSRPVSLLDIYPTLMAQTGVSAPHDLDGTDLSPILRGETPEGSDGAMAVWGQFEDDADGLMAFTLRTPDHRYTIYWDGGEELYDSRADPFEHDNLMVGAGGNVRILADQYQDRLNRELSTIAPRVTGRS